MNELIAGEILVTVKYSERENTTREGGNIDGDIIYEKLLEKINNASEINKSKEI